MNSLEEGLKRSYPDDCDAETETDHKNKNIKNETDQTIATTDGLSKSQIKKLKKKEIWEKAKVWRRAKEKERLRQKKIEAKMNNTHLGPSRKELKNTKMATSKCKVSIVVDMSFDELMDARSIGKCNKQLLHCYSLNRRADNPMQLYFTSLSGQSEAEMAKHDGYKHWDVNVTSDHFLNIFAPEKIIYLTSESDNMVEDLEDDNAYIIGGLVDHNAHKGHCFEVAKKLGVKHAQLPIGQYLDMKTRKVLTIDHVFTILLQVSNGKSWKEAFLQVLPQRKGALEKVSGLDSSPSAMGESSLAINSNCASDNNPQQEDVLSST